MIELSLRASRIYLYMDICFEVQNAINFFIGQFLDTDT